MSKIIYHGSNIEVAFPKIIQNGFYKDFGYGFYCTNLKKQAIRWASIHYIARAYQDGGF